MCLREGGSAHRCVHRPFQKPVPLSVGETAGQTLLRPLNGVRDCASASRQEPQPHRLNGGPPPRPGSRPRGQSGELAPLPAGRTGAVGDPVSLSLPCSHEVGGHSAQARHDVPELWASAVQAHEVSAGAGGSELRTGPGVCAGAGAASRHSASGEHAACPPEVFEGELRGTTVVFSPSRQSEHQGSCTLTSPLPCCPPSSLMTQPSPDGSLLPQGECVF